MIFLPFMGYSPSIITTNTIQIIWVNTSRDWWNDRSDAYRVITDTFDWFDRYADVELYYKESFIDVDEDINALDACKDWNWTPKQLEHPTLLMVAWYPTQRVLTCGKDNVADSTVIHKSIVWGGIRSSELAHTLCHLYGANFHTMNGDILDITPTEDKDRYMYIKAYQQGIISERTKLAIGLN